MDIFISIFIVILQTNVRTVKEGSDIAEFVIIMTFFTLRIIFALEEQVRKVKREKKEQEFFDKYKKRIIKDIEENEEIN